MDDPQVASAHRGAKYGAVAGFVAAMILVNSPITFLNIQPGFVFGYWIGIGMAVGAGIGWWRAGRA